MISPLESLRPVTIVLIALVTCWIEPQPVLFAQALQEDPATANVPDGINDRFLDDDLNPEEWIHRWEVESREIFAARRDVVRALGLAAGDSVADIGCGTGLFVPLFANAVTPSGKVYAVDIAPKFVEFVRQRIDRAEMPHVEVVQCEVDDVKLPDRSISVAFLCDTYHHFEFPQRTLHSIRFALRPGGQLVVIDFERIPGVSSDWVMGHVRAGKDEVIKEIEQAGFVFDEEIDIGQFDENYMLRFRRP